MRLWPVGPTVELLKQRWKQLLLAEDRGATMKESGDRTLARVFNLGLTGEEWPDWHTPIGTLKASLALPADRPLCVSLLRPSVPDRGRSVDCSPTCAAVVCSWSQAAILEQHLNEFHRRRPGFGRAQLRSRHAPLPWFIWCEGCFSTLPRLRRHECKHRPCCGLSNTLSQCMPTSPAF